MLSRSHSERLFLRFFGEYYRQPLRSCDHEDLLTVRKVIPHPTRVLLMRNAETVRNSLQMGSSNLHIWSPRDCTWNAFVSCFVVIDVCLRDFDASLQSIGI